MLTFADEGMLLDMDQLHLVMDMDPLPLRPLPLPLYLASEDANSAVCLILVHLQALKEPTLVPLQRRGS